MNAFLHFVGMFVNKSAKAKYSVDDKENEKGNFYNVKDNLTATRVFKG